MMSKFSLLIFGLFCACLHAQTVRAPRAQALIDALMAKHPEMQTIGLHVTPPGLSESLNIACSKPGKVGKVSADLDTGVASTGKPSMRRTPKGAFDMGVPITDHSGRPLGMIVVVIRETFTSDPEIALKRAFLIRDELQAQLPALADLFLGGLIVRAPLSMVAQTPLPDVPGSFGHFAFDLQHDRFFVAAEGNHSVEVFNLAGEHLSGARVGKSPRTLAFDRQSNLLLVTDAEDASCIVIDASDLHMVKRIPLPARPGAAIFDPESRLFYIGAGDSIAVMSAAELKLTRSLHLKTAGAASLALDHESNLLYVNLPGKDRIAVVSLTSGAIQAEWKTAGANVNAPMALDASHHRLFVATPKPGKLQIFDTESGKVRQQSLDCIGSADDMSFDSVSKRVYITGLDGVSIFAEGNAGSYVRESQFGTMKGRTSAYVSALKRLYTIHAQSEEDGPGLQVYQVNR